MGLPLAGPYQQTPWPFLGIWISRLEKERRRDGEGKGEIERTNLFSMTMKWTKKKSYGKLIVLLLLPLTSSLHTPNISSLGRTNVYVVTWARRIPCQREVGRSSGWFSECVQYTPLCMPSVTRRGRSLLRVLLLLRVEVYAALTAD